MALIHKICGIFFFSSTLSNNVMFNTVYNRCKHILLLYPYYFLKQQKYYKMFTFKLEISHDKQIFIGVSKIAFGEKSVNNGN